jgi:signal transduction histidine kinase
LEQLFFALSQNAIQAADGTRPSHLIISGELVGDRIELQFRDDCGGIAPKNLERIFEPFFTTKSAGLGMGLAICRRIIESHGGRVWAVNNASEGATVSFSLPSVNHRRGESHDD